MSNYKTAYLLKLSEIKFVMNCVGDAEPSNPAKYILDNMLPDITVNHEAAESLAYKRLVRKEYGRVVLEPVMELLARSALKTRTIWIMKSARAASAFEDNDNTSVYEMDNIYILKTADFNLMAYRYPHVPDTWKIIPHKNKKSIIDDLETFSIINLICIDESGKKRENIKPGADFAWLDGD
jgi:hypothetical protein